jgi:hypothetical protein
MALGAPRFSVLKLVVGRAFGLSAAGIAIGCAASLVLTRFMTGLLYGVSAADPLIFVNVAMVLFAVALAAVCCPPSRNELIGTVERQRPQQNRVDHAENGRVRSDTERERENRKRAEPLAKILEQCWHGSPTESSRNRTLSPRPVR